MKHLLFRNNLSIDLEEDDEEIYGHMYFLYKEWRIFITFFGKLIVINGPSSSGKTTISRCLEKFGFNTLSIDDIWYECFYNKVLDQHENQKIKNSITLVKGLLTQEDFIRLIDGLPLRYNKFLEHEKNAIDNLRSEIPNIFRSMELPSPIEIFDTAYEKAREFLFLGRNIILDLVVSDVKYFSVLSYCFRYYPLNIALMYTPLDEGLKRCGQRNYKFFKSISIDYRYPGQVISQYLDFYNMHGESSVSISPLEVLFKKNIKKVLKNAVQQQNLLDNFLKERNIDEISQLQTTHNIHSQIDFVLEKINSFPGDTTYVFPKVDYDILIRTKEIRQFDEQGLWYTDSHVMTLLMDRLSQDHFFVVAPTIFNADHLLLENLNVALVAATNGLIVVMPVHLHGNHWVGIVIRPIFDNENLIVGLNIFYYDPFGEPLELEENYSLFIHYIRNYLGINFDNLFFNFIDLRVQHQTNGYDCGLFTTKILTDLALARDNEIDKVNITAEEVLESINSSIYQTPEIVEEIREFHNSIFAAHELELPQYYQNEQKAFVGQQNLSTTFCDNDFIYEENPILDELQAIGQLLGFISFEGKF